MLLAAGSIVEFESREHAPLMGIVLSISTKGVRVLLPNRKEITINERNVLHASASARVGIWNIDEACANAVKIDSKRSKLAGDIDLAALHNLLSEEIRPYRLHEMADFLACPADDDLEAALLRRLWTEQWYFKSRKEGWMPTSRAELESMLLQERQRSAQEQADSELLEALKKMPAPQKPLPKVLIGFLDKLVESAVWNDEASISKKQREIMAKAGLTQPRKVFDYLVRLGVFKPDENLLLRRHRITADFSNEVNAAAELVLVQPLNASARRDMRGISTWAIDSEDTLDRDDAFSISMQNDETVLAVHIADPTSSIPPGSLLEREACRRGASIYMPDEMIPMLPRSLSEGAFALTQDSDRPALTITMRFNCEGELKNSTIEQSIIRVTHATDYASADTQLAAGNDELATAFRLASHLREHRKKSGAMMFARQPERKIHLNDGRVKLCLQPVGGFMQETVAEFMIWANYVAAEWCTEHNIPCLYRVQDKPDEIFEISETFDPLAFFAAIRKLKKTVVTTKIGPHAGLGLSAYCQITSPLRRYNDFLLHRQIVGFLTFGCPAADTETLEQMAMNADEAVRIGEEIMKRRDWYYILKYIKTEIDEGRGTSFGTVVDVSSDFVVVYIENLAEYRHVRKPAFEVTVGGRVSVKFQRADAFDGILQLKLEKVV